jgi:hypothetical protein
VSVSEHGIKESFSPAPTCDETENGPCHVTPHACALEITAPEADDVWRIPVWGELLFCMRERGRGGRERAEGAAEFAKGGPEIGKES